MRQEPKLWNVGLIVLVVSIGFFIPGGEAPPKVVTSVDQPTAIKKDPKVTTVKPDVQGGQVAAVSPPDKEDGKGPKKAKTDEEKAEEWDKLVDEKAEKFDKLHKELEKEPVVDPDWIDEDFTREEIEKGLARAENVYQAHGHLHTLPAEQREAKLAKIREAAYELQYNPDNPLLHVEHAKALEEAKLDSPALSAMSYAFNKFPDSQEAAIAYGDMGAKWSLRHVAEVAYERAIQLDPGNQHAKEGLDKVSTWEYHPGYVAMGWIPEERLKHAKKSE